VGEKKKVVIGIQVSDLSDVLSDVPQASVCSL